MTEYQGLSREELIERIQALERLVDEFQRERVEEQRLDYAWTGNLGHWYWSVPSNTVTFNPLKVTTLGYEPGEIPEEPDYQFFTDMLHPEDYSTAMKAMRLHLSGEKKVYETEYRIRTKGGNWRWYHDIGKITQRDDKGDPLLVSGIVFDVTERRKLEQQLKKQNRLLEQLATTDELTGLWNRRMIFKRLEEEISRARRYQEPLVILILDVDHFKEINDCYGHLQGDRVLQDIARVIEDEIREVDIPGRYGGEEFLVLLPNTGLEGARAVAERIRQRIRETTFGDELTATISGGLSLYKGENLEEYLHQADKKLFQAKRKGRNRIVG